MLVHLLVVSRIRTAGEWAASSASSRFFQAQNSHADVLVQEIVRLLLPQQGSACTASCDTLKSGDAIPRVARRHARARSHVLLRAIPLLGSSGRLGACGGRGRTAAMRQRDGVETDRGRGETVAMGKGGWPVDRERGRPGERTETSADSSGEDAYERSNCVSAREGGRRAKSQERLLCLLAPRSSRKVG